MTKIIRQQRTVRFHALRAGDEVEHQRKWWLVVGSVRAGGQVTTFDPKTDTSKVMTVLETADGERVLAYQIKRGSYVDVLYGGRNVLTKIIRTRHAS